MKRRRTRGLLKKEHLAPKKRLGQNFLVHPPTVEAILDHAAPDPEAVVVELGVGLGALTIPLARRVRRVIGIEIDAGIVRLHRESGDLPDNVTLIHEDLLRSDFKALARECGGRLTIIANLPYSISNPLLFKLLDHHEDVGQAVLMLQKEVADRLTAVPGTKAYGVLSALLPLYATVNRLMRIGPEQFHPRPKVDSAVVGLDFTRATVESTPRPDVDSLKRVIKAAFGQRRKTLVNSLAAGGIAAGDKAVLTRHLQAAGIDPSSRADHPTPAQYAELAGILFPHPLPSPAGGGGRCCSVSDRQERPK